MIVHFFDRHTGIAGAAIPLPDLAREIAGGYEDGEGDPDELVRELREAYPDGTVRDIPPSDGCDGMITLVLPATGFPRHLWRVIKYRVSTEAAR